MLFPPRWTRDPYAAVQHLDHSPNSLPGLGYPLVPRFHAGSTFRIKAPESVTVTSADGVMRLCLSTKGPYWHLRACPAVLVAYS